MHFFIPNVDSVEHGLVDPARMSDRFVVGAWEETENEGCVFRGMAFGNRVHAERACEALNSAAIAADVKLHPDPGFEPTNGAGMEPQVSYGLEMPDLKDHTLRAGASSGGLEVVSVEGGDDGSSTITFHIPDEVPLPANGDTVCLDLEVSPSIPFKGGTLRVTYCPDSTHGACDDCESFDWSWSPAVAEEPLPVESDPSGPEVLALDRKAAFTKSDVPENPLEIRELQLWLAGNVAKGKIGTDRAETLRRILRDMY